MQSMRCDLHKTVYTSKTETDNYIYGSANVVGLMCLKVFCGNNNQLFEQLEQPAMKLGSAFQKVNFLRDINDDSMVLGRVYFHQLVNSTINDNIKQQLITDIESDFKQAYEGIKLLPKNCRLAVLTAYLYYLCLLYKIKKTPAEHLAKKRVRIPGTIKFAILAKAIIVNKLQLV